MDSVVYAMSRLYMVRVMTMSAGFAIAVQLVDSTPFSIFCTQAGLTLLLLMRGCPDMLNLTAKGTKALVAFMRTTGTERRERCTAEYRMTEIGFGAALFLITGIAYWFTNEWVYFIALAVLNNVALIWVTVRFRKSLNVDESRTG